MTDSITLKSWDGMVGCKIENGEDGEVLIRERLVKMGRLSWSAPMKFIRPSCENSLRRYLYF